MTDTHTHTHTHIWRHPCLPLMLRVYKHTHTHLLLQDFQERFHYTHRHTSSCVLEICLMMTHTYTHPYPCPRLIVCTITYFSFTLTRAFPLRSCSVTRNWRAYYKRVRRVFLVETVILQTVLGDIQGWSTRFLFFFLLIGRIFRNIFLLVMPIKRPLLFCYRPQNNNCHVM